MYTNATYVKIYHTLINIRSNGGDTLKFLTIVLENVLKKLDWNYSCINVDGEYLNHHRLADDMILIIQKIKRIETNSTKESA